MPTITIPTWGKITTPKQVPIEEEQVTTPTPTQPFGISPFGKIPALATFEEKLQQAQELQQKIKNSIPLTDEVGQQVTIDLYPTDFGLSEDVQNVLLNVSYEGDEIVGWKPRPGMEDIKPTQLSFSVDKDTGDILVLSDGKAIGEANKQTGEISLDEGFIKSTQDQYLGAYGKTAPVTTWGTGIPITTTNKLGELLYSKIAIGGTTLPAPAEVLGTVGLIGSLAIMGYQALSAVKNVVSSGAKKVLDLFIKSNSKDILKVVQLGNYATGKNRILQNLYNFHGRYIATRAQELFQQQRAATMGVARAEGVARPTISLLESAIKTSTQTANSIADAIKTGKDLTATNIQGLIATGTPAEFSGGISAIIAGQTIIPSITGVVFNPIITPVGKGYEIIQNGQPVGEVSYSTELPGVKGIVIDRIDIAEAARRQGLATQAIDRVLAEAETAGVPLYTGILEQDGVQLMNALEQRGVINLSPAPQRMLGNVVTRGAPEYTPTTAMAEEAITGEIPVGKVEVTGIPTGEKQLRQSIMATVKGKKLSETKYRALFKKVGGSKKLTEMGAPELQQVLDAVRDVRPVKIRGATVIIPKTERGIQTLKDRLIAEKKLTPEIYESLKKDLGLETDKYESRELFITERQARNLIRQMNVESEVGLTKWDILVSGGLANKPELKTSIDKLSERIVVENQPKPKKDITIPFGKTASEISEFPNDVKLSGSMAMLRALRRFQEQLGGREATRIYEVAEMMVEQRRLNEITLANTVNSMKMEVPQLATIIKDKDAMARIQQWLDSDLKIADIKKPDLAPAELEVAQLFRRRYGQWKDTVRLERFKDAYYHFGGRAKEVVADLIKYGTEEAKDVSIPDAPLKDIKEAITIYETQGEVALREYLNTKDWGVLKSGYSFSQILHPKLRMYRGTSVRATTTSLHQRKGLEFLRDERTPWERLVAYERQMIGLNLQPYYRKMDTEFRRAQEGDRISPESANDAARRISLFMREIKGFPIESPAVALLLRIGGWSFGTLAKVPWMSVRNLHQNIAFHPDKSEIVKSFFGRGFFSNPLTKRGRLDYTDALVHQYKGVQQEQILMGYMGKTPLENLIRKTDYYHLSDKANRYMSMNGSGAKAERALNQYLKDRNVEKFLKNSGANELSTTEQLRILEYLALDRYDYGATLEAISGGEAAIRDIANRITTLNHFNYVRYLRSSIEMGEAGRVFGSLVAFPRSVGERYADIFSRIKRLDGADRKRAIHALIAMVIGSVIASAMLSQLTGKKRDAYNPLLIMQWQVGGLATGATQEIMELYRLLTNLSFAEDEGQKKFYGDEIVLLIPRLGDMFIPFYATTMNLLESLANARYIDRKWLRQIRETFDENYELNEEYYEIERDMLEGIQHGLFGTRTPDPSEIEQALKRLKGGEELLGEIDTEALDKARQRAEEKEQPFEYEEDDFLYTTSKLGSDINGAIRNLEPSEIITENGFSPLVLQYLEYQEMWDDYGVVPSDKRYDYRKANPEIDANLFFWSYVTTLQSNEAEQIVLSMAKRFNIPPLSIKGYENVFGAMPGQFPTWGQTPAAELPEWSAPIEGPTIPTWG